MKKTDKRSGLTTIVLLVLDLIFFNIAYFGSIWIRYDFTYSLIPQLLLKEAIKYAPLFTIITIVLFFLFGLYKSLLAFVSSKEVVRIVLASATSIIIQYLIFTYVIARVRFPLGFFVIEFFMLFLLTIFSRFLYRFTRFITHEINKNTKHKNPPIRTMVIGAGEAGKILIRELEYSDQLNNTVVAVIDDDPDKHGRSIEGIKIYGGRDRIVELAEKKDVELIIFAIPSIADEERRDILNYCKETGCQIKALPGIYQLIKGEVTTSELRDIDLEDLLEREPVDVNLQEIIGYIEGEVVLVTGGGGTIGSELCRQIACHKPAKLIIFDIYENNAYAIQLELRKKYPDLDLEVLIGSVRDKGRLESIFSQEKPGIIYHAAAHKHVPLMEVSPNEAVKNNVFGTLNVAKMADIYGAKRFVLISTDKAVNPTNIMGATKRICEMIIQTIDRHSETDFVAVRFGNVLGSSGSVVPIFKKQIEEGGPVTVTHPDIERFFMTIPEAVSLVLQAGAYAQGGEIFILDMGKPVKIVDMANNLIKLSGLKPGEDIEIVFTGLRPGEKLYEEILMEEEGLQKTKNERIKIGKPIQLDEEDLKQELKDLYVWIYEEPSEEELVKRLSQLVPTYKKAKEGIPIEND